MLSKQIQRKARWVLEMEDRHGKPAGLHYVWWGTAIAAVFLLEINCEPMHRTLHAIDAAIGPPDWAWMLAGFVTIPLIAVAFALRHKPLGWSRTYRRILRRGSFAHGVAAWFRDAATVYLSALPLAMLAVTVQN